MNTETAGFKHPTFNIHQSSLRFRLRTASPRQVASARHPTSNWGGADGGCTAGADCHPTMKETGKWLETVGKRQRIAAQHASIKHVMN
jgi:hypothetical protein